MDQLNQAVAVQTAPEAPAPSRPAIKVNWWLVGGLAILIAATYSNILTKLFHDWMDDPNFSHGIFVPLFSGFLVWEKRESLLRIPLKPSWFGLAAIVGGIGILLLGVLGADLFTQRFSLIVLLCGLVLFFCGWQYLRSLAFPLAVLVLAIPLPQIIFNQVTFPLQLLASRLASVLLPLFNVPVLRQGNIIQLPTMPLEVAEACSGIRSLLSLGTLAVIYGYFLEKSVLKRLILLVAAIPIAVAANAARIVGTGLMVQYWDPNKALGFFHEFSGWVIFLVSLALLLGFHGLMKFLPGGSTAKTA